VTGITTVWFIVVGIAFFLLGWNWNRSREEIERVNRELLNCQDQLRLYTHNEGDISQRRYAVYLLLKSINPNATNKNISSVMSISEETLYRDIKVNTI